MLRESLKLGVFLLEPSDKGQLLLDGLLLGKRGGLLVQDLLLGPSPHRSGLHAIGKKIGKHMNKTKQIGSLQVTASSFAL